MALYPQLYPRSARILKQSMYQSITCMIRKQVQNLAGMTVSMARVTIHIRRCI
jgi:hypothetical protein